MPDPRTCPVRRLAHNVAGREDPVVGGCRFRLYAKDGDDLGVREFSEPNCKVGDTISLRDRIYRVYRVVYLDDDAGVRGMLMLEEHRTELR